MWPQPTLVFLCILLRLAQGILFRFTLHSINRFTIRLHLKLRKILAGFCLAIDLENYQVELPISCIAVEVHLLICWPICSISQLTDRTVCLFDDLFHKLCCTGAPVLHAWYTWTMVLHRIYRYLPLAIDVFILVGYLNGNIMPTMPDDARR